MAPRATRLEVRVTPHARRAGILGRHGEGWRISVTAPPDRGRANAALVTLLAARLGVPSASIRVLSGRAARAKVVEIDGLEAAHVDRLLVAAEQER